MVTELPGKSINNRRGEQLLLVLPGSVVIVDQPTCDIKLSSTFFLIP